EIAAELVHPVTGRTIAEMRDALPGPSGIVRVEHGLGARLDRDLQNEAPAAVLRLARVGVRDMRRIIRLRSGPLRDDGRHDTLVSAVLDLVIGLAAAQHGAPLCAFTATREAVRD